MEDVGTNTGILQEGHYSGGLLLKIIIAKTYLYIYIFFPHNVPIKFL